jgi:hypothetical protein
MTHHTFGGRKSKFTAATRQVILDAIRGGRSMNEAAMEASTTYRNLVRWRHIYAHFAEAVQRARAQGEKVRAARRKITPRRRKHGLTPEELLRGQVTNELERGRLIRLREQMLNGKVTVEKPIRVRSNGNGTREQIWRLQRLRKAWEAEQAAEAKAVVSTLPELQQDARAEVLEAKILPYIPETLESAQELPIQAEVIDVQEPSQNDSGASPAPPAATFKADPPMIGGRSPASWREPTNDEDLGSL